MNRKDFIGKTSRIAIETAIGITTPLTTQANNNNSTYDTLIDEVGFNPDYAIGFVMRG